jgi:hypothetical protein
MLLEPIATIFCQRRPSTCLPAQVALQWPPRTVVTAVTRVSRLSVTHSLLDAWGVDRRLALQAAAL